MRLVVLCSSIVFIVRLSKTLVLVVSSTGDYLNDVSAQVNRGAGALH